MTQAVEFPGLTSRHDVLPFPDSVTPVASLSNIFINLGKFYSESGVLTSNSAPQFKVIPAATTRHMVFPCVIEPKKLKELLYDSASSFKIHTNRVAMYLDDDWRNGFFSQIDNLLDVDNWETEDCPPSIGSFSTLLRLTLAFGQWRRPGIGTSSTGMLIAAWTTADARLTVECLPTDRLRWTLRSYLNGELEAAAGESSLGRLGNILEPYGLGRRFFKDAKS